MSRFGAVIVAAACVGGFARADVTIIGALSNFDCPNTTGQVCDEFEIELVGPHLSDCYGTYGNYNYGMGRVAANAAGTGIVVDYRRIGHSTNPGAIEHFGVHLTNFNIITSRKFGWKRNGVLVTSGGGSPPVTIPRTSVTPAGLAEVVENEQPDRVIWVKRKVVEVDGAVPLANLMPNDPIILGAQNVSVDFEQLDPGQTLSVVRPLPATGAVRSQIIVVETYADIATWNPVTQDFDHRAGSLVSRAMSATVTQNPACLTLSAITGQPQSVVARLDAAAEFTVAAQGPAGGGPIAYQWRHDGVEMVGEDTALLRVDPVTLADAGAYTCVVTNDCGVTESAAARLTVFVCGADFDESGSLTVGDIFDFLDAWFVSNPRADFNHANGLSVQDIFDFLSAWFAGCP
jgi:hypothetical protein